MRIVFITLLYALTLGKFIPDSGVDIGSLIGPFEWLRINGRLISITLIMILVGLLSVSRQRLRIEPAAVGWCLILFHGMVMMRNMGVTNLVDAILRFAVFCLLLLIAINIPRVKDSSGNSVSIIDALAWSGVISTFIIITQAVVNPFPLFFASGRMLGLTLNPQIIGLFSSLSIVALITAIQIRRGWALRMIFLFTISAQIGFVILSGSRTSLLTLVVGLVVVLWKRISLIKLILMTSICLVAVFAFVDLGSLIEGQGIINSESIGRIFSTDDTRSHVFESLGEVFLDNYWSGKAMEQGKMVEFGENSILASGASLGIGGVLLIMMVMYALIEKALESMDSKDARGRGLAAMILMVIVGSFTEAIITGTMTSFVLVTLTAYYEGDDRAEKGIMQ